MTEIQAPYTDLNPPQDALLDNLDNLLIEIAALAVRLKQDARRVRTTGEPAPRGHNILRFLGRFGPLTVPQIARLDSTSRQNVQSIVNRLERYRLVESTRNPVHKRSELVRLTDRGVASLEMVSRNAEAYKKKLLPHVPEADLIRATQVLRTIRERICTTDASWVQNETSESATVSSKTLNKTGDISPNPNPVRSGQEVEVARIFAEENELPISLL